MTNLRRYGDRLLNRESIFDFIDEMEPDSVPPVLESVVARPQPRQSELFRAAGVLEWFESDGQEELREPLANRIGYGGAVFGSKTYGMLILADVLAHAYPGIQIAFFRRKYTELDGPGAAMMEANEVFHSAKRRDGGKHWHWPWGSDFYFRHCEHENTVYDYQSQQIDVLMLDEATHFTWFQVEYLLTRNRVSGNSGIKQPFAVMCSNPGGIGHDWYMELFDLEKRTAGGRGDREHEQVKHVKNPSNKWLDTYFIPSFMADNKIGMERDPDYEKRLRESDPATADALIDGDWTIFTGQAFREWEADKHICDMFEIPDGWPRWRATDWGYDAPFVTLWFTRDIDTRQVYVYRELYAKGLTDKQQANQIAMYSPDTERVIFHFADPSMWTSKNVRGIVSTTAMEYQAEGITIMKGDNDRLNGNKKVHRMLANQENGKPGIVFFRNCVNSIRTIPRLAVNPKNREDVNPKGQDDHCYDALRYGLTNVDVSGGKKRSNRRRDGSKKDPYSRYQRML